MLVYQSAWMVSGRCLTHGDGMVAERRWRPGHPRCGCGLVAGGDLESWAHWAVTSSQPNVDAAGPIVPGRLIVDGDYRLPPARQLYPA